MKTTVPNFEDMNASTITYGTVLNKCINLELLVKLLPCITPEITEKQKKLKKIKTPHYPKINLILGLRYAQIKRGIYKFINGSSFKNGIEGVITSKNKNLKFKIFKQKIHICGCKDQESCDVALDYLIDKINQINDLYKNLRLTDILNEFKDYLNSDQSKHTIEKTELKVVKYLFNNIPVMNYVNVKYQNLIEFPHQFFEIDRLVKDIFTTNIDNDYQEIFNYQDIDINDLNKLIDFLEIEVINQTKLLHHDLKCKNNKSEEEVKSQQVEQIENNNDKDLSGDSLESVKSDQDYNQEHNLCHFCSYSYNSDQLVCLSKKKIINNYNFELGNKINRSAIRDFFNDNDGFFATFDPTISHIARIEHSYESDKVKNKNRITIMIYRSGKVTLSGPNEEIMEPIYNKFKKMIEDYCIPNKIVILS